MDVLVDHLSATVIGTTVLLVLLGIGLRMTETGTDQQVYETSQRMSQALAQQLEGDLLNVGYGLPASTAPIESWTDSTFTFRRRSGEALTDPILTVEYRRVTTDSTVVDGAPRPVYTVERYENGVYSGGSTALLSTFDIDVLGDSGTPPATLEDTRAIRVRFVMSFGSGDNHTENSSRYSRTFRPANLDS